MSQASLWVRGQRNGDKTLLKVHFRAAHETLKSDRKPSTAVSPLPYTLTLMSLQKVGHGERVWADKPAADIFLNKFPPDPCQSGVPLMDT